MPTLPLSVVILIQPGQGVDALQNTLDALGHADEILIADAVGFDLSRITSQTTLTQLPLIGLPKAVLRYRGALAAQNDWVLFLSPGDTISQELEAFLSNVTRGNGATSLAYTFPRKLTWLDVIWEEPASVNQPDLVCRTAYLESATTYQSLEVFPSLIHLDRLIRREGLLQALEESAHTTAHQRLREEGASSLQRQLPTAWLKEVFGKAFTCGILQGWLFQGHIQRMRLFLALLKTHFLWFRLYADLQSTKRPLPPSGA